MFAIRRTGVSAPPKGATDLADSRGWPSRWDGRVAIAVGSRGIADLANTVSHVVALVRQRGGRPVIVPAMGSHGGATADGQSAVLRRLGLTESAIGCPIESSMETVVLDRVEFGDVPFDLHFDAVAAAADHVIVVNRVKPHTRLVGPLQSGLCKMSMIGLGKHAGASAAHGLFRRFGYQLEPVARRVVPMVIDRAPPMTGLAMIEGEDHRVDEFHVLPARRWLDEEPELLRRAAAKLPRLPFDHADLLIVDRIGKDISGTGMDTNVVGRKSNDNAAMKDEFPKLNHIYVRSLSEATGGNAAGIGIAEFCHARVIERMDREATWVNCLTSGHVTAAAIPIHYPTDQQVLGAALTQSVDAGPEAARWMWIRDTGDLDRVVCSEAYWEAAGDQPGWRIEGPPQRLRFDAGGQLIDPIQRHPSP